MYEKGIVVGANYFPYYPDPHPWEPLEPMAVQPLLGKYDVRDSMVISRHIDWATGHGINCFFMSWVPTWAGDSLKLLNNIRKFEESPLSSDIKISIQYEGVEGRIHEAGVEPVKGTYHIWNRDQWKMIIEDMETLDRLFFRKENFLKIGDRPVIYFYASGALAGNVSGFIKEIKREVNLFIICDYAHPWAATSAYTIDNSGGWVEECDESGYCELIDYAKNFDAWTVWAAGWYTPIEEPLNENYPRFLDEGYKVWSKLAKKYNKILVPSTIPGFIDLRDPSFPRLPREADMFKEMFRIALKYATPINGKKLVKIDTFNEFGEATGIEPTKEEGFAFLEALKDVLSAPLVSNLSWSPLDVRNDKVYSLRVWFEAEDIAVSSDSFGIRRAELHFIPKVYEHLPEDTITLIAATSKIASRTPNSFPSKVAFNFFSTFPFKNIATMVTTKSAKGMAMSKYIHAHKKNKHLFLYIFEFKIAADLTGIS